MTNLILTLFVCAETVSDLKLTVLVVALIVLGIAAVAMCLFIWLLITEWRDR